MVLRGKKIGVADGEVPSKAALRLKVKQQQQAATSIGDDTFNFAPAPTTDPEPTSPKPKIESRPKQNKAAIADVRAKCQTFNVCLAFLGSMPGLVKGLGVSADACRFLVWMLIVGTEGATGWGWTGVVEARASATYLFSSYTAVRFKGERDRPTEAVYLGTCTSLHKLPGIMMDSGQLDQKAAAFLTQMVDFAGKWEGTDCSPIYKLYSVHLRNTPTSIATGRVAVLKKMEAIYKELQSRLPKSLKVPWSPIEPNWPPASVAYNDPVDSDDEDVSESPSEIEADYVLEVDEQRERLAKEERVLSELQSAISIQEKIVLVSRNSLRTAEDDQDVSESPSEIEADYVLEVDEQRERLAKEERVLSELQSAISIQEKIVLVSRNSLRTAEDDQDVSESPSEIEADYVLEVDEQRERLAKEERVLSELQSAISIQEKIVLVSRNSLRTAEDDQDVSESPSEIEADYVLEVDEQRERLAKEERVLSELQSAISIQEKIVLVSRNSLRTAEDGLASYRAECQAS